MMLGNLVVLFSVVHLMRKRFVYCNDSKSTDHCYLILHFLANVCSRYGLGMVANFKPDSLLNWVFIARI